MIHQLARKVYETLGPRGDLQIDDGSKLKAYFEENRRPCLKDYLPYVGHRDGLYINKNSTGFVFEALPLVGVSKDIENKLAKVFRSTLPKGSSIQFLLQASPHIQDFLDNYIAARSDSRPVFLALARRRAQLLMQMSREGRYPARNFSLLISVSLPRVSNNPVFIEEVQQLKTTLLGVFKHSGFAAWDCAPEAFVHHMRLLLGPCSEEHKIPLNELETLSNQMVEVDAEMQVHPEYLLYKTGDVKRTLYGIKHYPKEWMLGAMGRFIGDFFNSDDQVTCPFALHYGVHICDEKGLRTKIQLKCANVEKQARSPFAKWLPDIQRESEEWRYVRESLDKNDRVVRTQFGLI